MYCNADTKSIAVNTCTVCILEKQNVDEIYNILPFEKCAGHLQYFIF